MLEATFIGTSLTHGIAPDDWVYKLGKRMEPGTTFAASQFSPWSGIAGNNTLTGFDVKFYNAGIGSETTAMMLARQATDSLGHASTVAFIEGGMNDTLTGVPTATTIANLKALVDAEIGAGRYAVVQSHTQYNAASPAQQASILAINAEMKAYCETVGAHYMDTYTAWDDPANPGTSTYLDAGGVHPTAAGQTIQANIIPLCIFAEAIISDAVQDWIVGSDGKLLDQKTGTYATVGGVLGGVIPTRRAMPSGRGTEALFDTVNCTIPTTGWNVNAGTLVAVHTPLWAYNDGVTHDIISHSPAANKNRIILTKHSANAQRLYMGGANASLVSVDSAVTDWASGKRVVSAAMWQADGSMWAFNDAVPSAKGTTDLNDAFLATAYIGSSNGTTLYYNGYIHRVLVFARRLTMHELNTLINFIENGPPVVRKNSSAGGGLSWL